MSATLWQVLDVPLDQIVESPANVRVLEDAGADAELLASVEAQGILTPGIARPIRGTSPQRYELAAGHRRFRAAQAARLASIPLRVRELDDRAFREIMVTENLQRSNPHPLDEAAAYAALQNEFGYDLATLTARFGKSETYVRERLALTNLGGAAVHALLGRRIELGHAIALARVDHDAQARFLTEVLGIAPAAEADADAIADAAHERAFGVGTHEIALTPELRAEAIKTRVSVAELKARMAEGTTSLSEAKWDVADATLVPAAGACTACPKRTAAEPALFPELAGDDRCRDALCWGAKRDAWLASRVAALQSQGDVVLISLEHRGVPKTVAGQPVLSAAKWEHRRGKVAAARAKVGLIVHTGAYATAKLGETLEIALPAPKPASARPTPTATRGRSPAVDRRTVTQRYAWCTAAIAAVATAIRVDGMEPCVAWLRADVADAILASHNLGSTFVRTWLAPVVTAKELDAITKGTAAPGLRAFVATALAVAGDGELVRPPGMYDCEHAWPLEDDDLCADALVAVGRLRGVDVRPMLRAELAAREAAATPAPASGTTPPRAKTPGRKQSGTKTPTAAAS